MSDVKCDCVVLLLEMSQISGLMNLIFLKIKIKMKGFFEFTESSFCSIGR